ncbi:MAG: non-heme iron oxygenase ferredoxin subunit [Planctomycetota bacterium]
MGFVRALAKADLQPGQGKQVMLEGRKIAVFNVNGKYQAVDDTCSHEEASLAEGAAYAEGCRCVVECPSHGSRFDLESGKALTLPAVRPVRVYAVREVDGVIEVEL